MLQESFDVDPEDPHHLQIKKGTGGIYGGEHCSVGMHGGPHATLRLLVT